MRSDSGLVGERQPRDFEHDGWRCIWLHLRGTRSDRLRPFEQSIKFNRDAGWAASSPSMTTPRSISVSCSPSRCGESSAWRDRSVAVPKDGDAYELRVNSDNARSLHKAGVTDIMFSTSAVAGSPRRCGRDGDGVELDLCGQHVSTTAPRARTSQREAARGRPSWTAPRLPPRRRRGAIEGLGSLLSQRLVGRGRDRQDHGERRGHLLVDHDARTSSRDVDHRTRAVHAIARQLATKRSPSSSDENCGGCCKRRRATKNRMPVRALPSEKDAGEY